MTTSWLSDRKQLEAVWKKQRDRLMQCEELPKVKKARGTQIERELRELNKQTAQRLYRNDPKMRRIKREFYKEWKKSKEDCVLHGNC